MTIATRTSGGKGYIHASITRDLTQGKQVAESTFAEGGTTGIKLIKAVKMQDLLLWVPLDSLSQNQLYIEKVGILQSASMPITDPGRGGTVRIHPTVPPLLRIWLNDTEYRMGVW